MILIGFSIIILLIFPCDSKVYFCSWLALARLEAKIGNIERSRDVFSQSVIRFPSNVHILHAWGHMEQVTYD